MRISTFFYCLKQGIINIRKNILFSLASIATISACIFLFSLFISIIVNVQYVVKNTESTVGITVFFDEELSESEILEVGEKIKARPEIKEINYISAKQAWERFQKEYFAHNEELAKGFADDNPLAGSASYEMFLHDIGAQQEVVTYLQGLSGVRQVNYSDSAAIGLSSFNKVIGLLSAVIIGILLAVAIFLISNTISVAAAFRKNENRIMKLIGATNYMIRAPFVVEGVIIGFVGSVIPLVAIYYLYRGAVTFILQKFQVLSGIFQFIPVEDIFPYLSVAAIIMGVGIGFVVSLLTIRKHLRV